MFAITYKALADSVEIEMIGPRPRLINYSQDLTLIGTGRSAYVFKCGAYERLKKMKYIIKNYLILIKQNFLLMKLSN